CPVEHGSAAPSSGSQTPAKADGCPVKHDGESGLSLRPYLNPRAYNVYGQRIDPTNQMPANPNNQPAPGQAAPLSTDRVTSNIPKGGSEGTWTYPSPQMFWNAMVRKGKGEGATEGDMDVVVAIHNNMNENTWRRILQWETLDCGEGGASGDDGRAPRLLRFLGRPHDLSPKAWLKTRLLGCPDPFDRHDWVVDRGGDEIRYVIDYYHDESLAPLDETPTSLADTERVRSIALDVRPALDSPAAAYRRFVAMPLARALGRSDFAPLPLLRPSPASAA
ncbi:unnamed protein product, partial [Phaeothamnion confervicola]